MKEGGELPVERRVPLSLSAGSGAEELRSDRVRGLRSMKNSVHDHPPHPHSPVVGGAARQAQGSELS